MDRQESAALELRSPTTEAQWERYFDLRWRVLRAPWNQPRGSEKDDHEDAGWHVGLWNASDAPVAVGRVQMNSPQEAQVRFMAVEPTMARKGLGSRILAELESRASTLGARVVVLNSRQEAQDFYRRHGYEVTGQAHTLFGAIPHVRMRKSLELPATSDRPPAV